VMCNFNVQAKIVKQGPGAVQGF